MTAPFLFWLVSEAVHLLELEPLIERVLDFDTVTVY